LQFDSDVRDIKTPENSSIQMLPYDNQAKNQFPFIHSYRNQLQFEQERQFIDRHHYQPPQVSNLEMAAINGTNIILPLGRQSSNLQSQWASDEILDRTMKSEQVLESDLAVVNVVLWNLHRQQMFQMDLLRQLQQQVVIAAHHQKLNGTSSDAEASAGSTSNLVTMAAATESSAPPNSRTRALTKLSPFDVDFGTGSNEAPPLDAVPTEALATMHVDGSSTVFQTTRHDSDSEDDYNGPLIYDDSSDVAINVTGSSDGSEQDVVGCDGDFSADRERSAIGPTNCALGGAAAAQLTSTYFDGPRVTKISPMVAIMDMSANLQLELSQQAATDGTLRYIHADELNIYEPLITILKTKRLVAYDDLHLSLIH